ncbi:MAG: hypothetical protein KIS79_06300 [Burkholderiales bacterium]|nr:hypothetical protein [Burkholderiales bacterium]
MGLRATKAEMAVRYDALVSIAAGIKPCTVRQLYYQSLAHGFMSKDESGYTKVQRAVQHLRQVGRIPYSWIVDSSCMLYQARTFTGVQDALDDLAERLRLDIWRDSPYRVEMWLEKRALYGVVARVTLRWQVPLYVSVGFSSESYLYEAAEAIAEADRETFVFLLTDNDPSGLDIEKSIRRKLPKFVDRVGGYDKRVHFERLGLTPEQVEQYNLPTRPTKRSTHSKNFKGESTDLDALRPAVLRDLIEDTILRFVNPDEVLRIEREEELAREGLRALDYSRLVGVN